MKKNKFFSFRFLRWIVSFVANAFFPFSSHFTDQSFSRFEKVDLRRAWTRDEQKWGMKKKAWKIMQFYGRLKVRLISTSESLNRLRYSKTRISVKSIYHIADYGFVPWSPNKSFSHFFFPSMTKCFVASNAMNDERLGCGFSSLFQSENYFSVFDSSIAFVLTAKKKKKRSTTH